MHRTTERFWECYLNLPRDIQELADKSFRLWIETHDEYDRLIRRR
jgi:hypothetical protein